MNLIGTVLPTAKSLKCSQEFARNEKVRKGMVADKLGVSKFRKVTTPDGEVQYWKNSRIYAVISRSMRVLWFKRRADGDYRIEIKEKV